MITFWTEIEVPDDQIAETEDPTMYDVDVSALNLVHDPDKIRFKVLRFIESREEQRT